MSKQKTLIEKLRSRSPASDIKWKDLKSLLEHFGYISLNNTGSRRKFYNKERNSLIICHEPHPSPCIDKGCAVDVAEKLKNEGFI